MDIPLLQPRITHWECERCPALDQTRVVGPHTRFHRCSGLGGAEVPMLERGSGSRLRLVERQDYVGDEHVQLINGRPVMAAVTDRPDGSNDAVIFAPAAALGRG